MENPIEMDDLGVPLFLETPIYLFTEVWMEHLELSTDSLESGKEKCRHPGQSVGENSWRRSDTTASGRDGEMLIMFHMVNN